MGRGRGQLELQKCVSPLSGGGHLLPPSEPDESHGGGKGAWPGSQPPLRKMRDTCSSRENNPQTAALISGAPSSDGPLLITGLIPPPPPPQDVAPQSTAPSYRRISANVCSDCRAGARAPLQDTPPPPATPLIIIRAAICRQRLRPETTFI